MRIKYIEWFGEKDGLMIIRSGKWNITCYTKYYNKANGTRVINKYYIKP